jgi:hypothetical protein
MPDPDDPPIAAPQPPQPPAPPAPPAPPVPPVPPVPPIVRALGTDDPRALTRRLVTAMRDRKTIDLSAFTPDLLGKIEQALIPELDGRELAAHGHQLRNMLRFALAEQVGLLAPLKPEQFTIEAMGTEQPVTELRGHGSVRLARDGSLQGKDRGGAYILTFDGNTGGVHWLQFIWRRIVASYPAGETIRAKHVPLQKRYTFRRGRAVVYTEDAANPRWSVDGVAPDSPFYEGFNTVERSPNRLRLVDSPSPNDMDVKDLFSSSAPPSKCVSTFTAATYLIKDREVLYRADLSRTWTIISGAGGSLQTEEGKWTGRGRATSKLAPEHRAALARQFPRWDYLPGDRIAPPVPRPPFQPLSRSHPDFVSWPAGKPPMDRFRAVANAANAKLIEDVEEDPSTQALTIRERVKRESLSFFPALRGNSTNPVPGETGFVDGTQAYHNPRLPHERFGALPKVAMLLGEDAFQWGTAPRGGTMPNERDKIYTLAVMRHEMTHGVHNRIAIEWLLKWRDELTKDDFPAWIGKQISDLDLDLVLTGVSPRGTAPTEVLAYAEGFVTALPFLPANPSLAAFPRPKLEEWPASIIELDGLLRKRNMTRADYVHKALDRRLRDVICGVLDRQQRDVLIQWMDFLTSVDPQQGADQAQKDSASLFRGAFGPQKRVLLSIRKIAQQCS